MIENSQYPKEITDQVVGEWFDEEDIDEQDKDIPAKSIEEKYAESQLRVVRSNMDFSLYSLKQNFADADYINLAPEYQRRHRWDDKKRSLLIESILMNIPIPPLFLFENDYNRYEVMDGRQRLDTVMAFLDNGFSLRGLEFWTELNGKRFRDLSEIIQRGLMRRTLSAIILLAETQAPVEDESDIRMVLFRRLNTGGVMLNPQELRNALYPSLFSKMIRSVAREGSFAKAWDIPPRSPNEEVSPPPILLKNSLYKSMADCELVLRFYAIKEMIQFEYKGALRKLLDKCLMRHQKDSAKEVAELHDEFLFMIETLNKLFSGKPFRLNDGRLSRPLYDALMVSLSLTPQSDIFQRRDAIVASLNKHLSTPDDYEILIGRGNTIESIKARVALATNILSSGV